MLTISKLELRINFRNYYRVEETGPACDVQEVQKLIDEQ